MPFVVCASALLVFCRLKAMLVQWVCVSQGRKEAVCWGWGDREQRTWVTVEEGSHL